MKFIQVTTTIDNESKAKEIAKMLLAKRLAGCVQISPVQSAYWWKNKIQKTKEWLILAKARAADYPMIESTIKSIHPYTVPEILATPILKGGKPYLDWLASETERK